jgi:hypothetical protein
MKVQVPKQYSPLFEAFKRVVTVKTVGEFTEIETAIGFELIREQTGMQRREFKKLFRLIQVSEGKKRWKHEKIIVEPKRNKLLFIRLSNEERKLVKALAKKRGESPAEYGRNAILERALDESTKEDLENSSKEEKT